MIRYCRLKLVARIGETRIYKDVFPRRGPACVNACYEIHLPDGGKYTFIGWAFSGVIRVATEMQ